MAGIIVATFSGAVILVILILLIYVLCLFKKFSQLRRNSKQFEESFRAHFETNENTLSDDEDVEGDPETTTLILYLPMALLSKWSSRSGESNSNERMTDEETSFFQLPSDQSTYYKYSLVDETSSDGMSGNTFKVSNGMIHQRSSLSSGCSKILPLAIDAGRKIIRKNTWDLIRVLKVPNWGNMDKQEVSSAAFSTRKNVFLPDIRIESLTFGKSAARDEKELLI